MMKKWLLAMIAVAILAPEGVTAAANAKRKTTRKTASQPVEWKKPIFADKGRDPTIPAVGGVRWFWATHGRNYQRRQQGNIDLVFLGDSITSGWPGGLFGNYYGRMKAVNFGCGGDKIQHTLMRLEGDDGELRGTNPKVIVLMLGINNMGVNNAEEIAYGLYHMVKRLTETECPKSKVLLLGILPTSGNGGSKIEDVNKRIAKLDNGENVQFLDMGPKFRGEDGKIKPELTTDGTHLSPRGYELWHDTMNPLLMKMWAEKPTTPKRQAAARKKPAGSAGGERALKARRLLQTAEQAERMGQRGAAVGLYSKLVKEYPETSSAKRARKRLDSLRR